MPPNLHFFLLRYGHYFFLLLGLTLTAWLWNEWGWKVILLFFIPGLFSFFVLPMLLQFRLHALCRGCGSPVRISEKKREQGYIEYIYRCHTCTCQHHTGVFFKSESTDSIETELSE